jgi:hypothetical protein
MNNQRVEVHAVMAISTGGDFLLPLDPPCRGTVARLRRADDGAWVRLDARGPDPWHPFPPDDATRSCYVLTYPEHAEPEQDSADPVTVVASDSRFHSLAEEIKAMRWDGVPRIDDMDKGPS